MTLTNLLQLDLRLVEPQFMPVLEAAERLWQRRGRPTERWQLVDFLGAVIDECAQHEVEYPPVFLARKSQLKRGSFVPVQISTKVSHESAARNGEQVQTAKPGSCAKCGGRGFVQRNGSASLCGCWGKK